MNGINCDADALNDYSGTLKKDFNSIVNSLNNIESAFKTMCNSNNWNAQTRDYFYRKCENVINNFEIVKNKCNNVNQYLESVVGNVKNAESSAGAAIENAFSGFKF